MKIVINCCWGGFGLSEEARKILKKSDWEIERTDSKLINLIESKGSDFVSYKGSSNLCIVEIPDEATDWEINEYDGSEEIICVINGKLKHYN